MSPNLLIGAIGSVSPPSKLATPVLNELIKDAVGDCGKSFIASAYAFTANPLACIFAVSNVYP